MDASSKFDPNPNPNPSPQGPLSRGTAHRFDPYNDRRSSRTLLPFGGHAHASPASPSADDSSDSDDPDPSADDSTTHGSVSLDSVPIFRNHLNANSECPNVPAPAPGSRAGPAGSPAAGATPPRSASEAAPPVAAPPITEPVSSTSVASGASGARGAVNLGGAPAASSVSAPAPDLPRLLAEFLAHLLASEDLPRLLAELLAHLLASDPAPPFAPDPPGLLAAALTRLLPPIPGEDAQQPGSSADGVPASSASPAGASASAAPGPPPPPEGPSEPPAPSRQDRRKAARAAAQAAKQAAQVAAAADAERTRLARAAESRAQAQRTRQARQAARAEAEAEAAEERAVLDAALEQSRAESPALLERVAAANRCATHGCYHECDPTGERAARSARYGHQGRIIRCFTCSRQRNFYFALQRSCPPDTAGVGATSCPPRCRQGVGGRRSGWRQGWRASRYDQRARGSEPWATAEHGFLEAAPS